MALPLNLTDLTEGARLDQFCQLHRYHAESLIPGAKVDLDIRDPSRCYVDPCSCLTGSRAHANPHET
jgi:hypothetical protein